MNAPAVACPSCGRKAAWDPANPWRPFCSERCKMADLGAWFLGGRALPGDAPDLLAGEDGPPLGDPPSGRQRDAD
ncbi:MAG: hypothetical protein RL026_532 [Pseudomonadota bacterium]|jgi:endogenous inhibitor of DNA gyrase (YacG/DUF329 family)